jgi:hypothetical protein
MVLYPQKDATFLEETSFMLVIEDFLKLPPKVAHMNLMLILAASHAATLSVYNTFVICSKNDLEIEGNLNYKNVLNLCPNCTFHHLLLAFQKLDVGARDNLPKTGQRNFFKFQIMFGLVPSSDEQIFAHTCHKQQQQED